MNRLNRGTVIFGLPYTQNNYPLCLVKAQSSAQILNNGLYSQIIFTYHLNLITDEILLVTLQFLPLTVFQRQIAFECEADLFVSMLVWHLQG